MSLGERDDEGGPGDFLESTPDTVDPVLSGSPAIAPSSLAEWQGRLYIGGLQAQGVIEVALAGQGATQERVLDFWARVRDVRAGVEGEILWVMTDGPDASIYQVMLAEEED